MESAVQPRQSQGLGRAGSFVAAALALVAAFVVPREAAAETIRLVAFGDSLTAGYQLPPADAFPAVLEKALKEKGWDVTIANAGVSGDTAAAGAARVDWSVPDGTHGVILELGANDALRGLDPGQTRKSLAGILERLKTRNIPVLLAGMYAPRNLGAAYYETFDAIYPALAEEYGVPLYPFFLDGVAQNAKLNLEDGIHPTGEGVREIVGRMLPAVEDFLRSIEAES